MPKVSVVIPAYNAMTYLAETVDSLFRQTFTDFEVLIIDDGSSDHIMQWVSCVIDPRVKLISQANQGVSVARNTGIAQAQGEYLAFLDADDLWEPTKLEKQVRCLDENSAICLVHTWMVLIDEQGQFSGKLMTPSAEGDAWEQVVQYNPVLTSSVVVRRCCFEVVGVFDQNLRSAEDWEMWSRLAAQYPFAVIKEPLVRYRQHPANTTRNWQATEQGLRPAIEKIFHSVPSKLLYLKSRTYGYANLNLGWKALQSGECKQAIHFYQQALAHYPQLVYSWNCIRLGFAILLMRTFGSQGYEGARMIKRILRQNISV